MPEGVIIEFDSRSGRGKIESWDDDKTYPFDRNSISDPLLKNLAHEGQEVRFGIVKNPRGDRAFQVARLG
jgi:cold shock CspA family protein